MVSVSSGWIEAHTKTLLPETFLEITYFATEPGLQRDATASANDEASFSETNDSVNGETKDTEQYGTLEHGLWGLDGNFTYFDESPEDPGYVSDAISDASGGFTANPVITIELGSLHTELIPGLTITWSKVYNQWASEFRVSAWAGSSLVAQATVTGNLSPVSPVWLDMERYNRITIEILKWSHPNQRARCLEIFLGLQNVYTKGDLMNFSHSQSVDLLSAALPKNEITFHLRNDDNRWNPDNPSGAEQYLLSRQEVRLRYGMTVDGKTEWIKGGTFWLSDWSTPSNGMEATFTARDALVFMNEAYAGPKSGTLYSIIEAAFVQANLPVLDDGSPRYVIDDSLKSYSTSFTGDYTMDQVVQMAAHAGNCTIHQDRDGAMRVEPWKESYSGLIIEPRISYNHPEYTISKPLKAVSVGYGDNKLRAVVPTTEGIGEVQTVDNEFVRTASDAIRVGQHTADLLVNRKVISGEFRADVRVDVLDNVIVTSKYASNIIALTEVSYSTTGGAIRGKYTGRVVSIDLKPSDRRLGEFYVGEV